MNGSRCRHTWYLIVLAALLAGCTTPRQQQNPTSSPSALSPSSSSDIGYPFNGDREQFATIKPPSDQELVVKLASRIVSANLGPDKHHHDLTVGEVVLTNPAGPSRGLLKSWFEWQEGERKQPLELLLAEQQPDNYQPERIEWISQPISQPTSSSDRGNIHLAVMLPPETGVHLVCLVPNRAGQLVVVTMMVDRTGPKERALEMPLIMAIEKVRSKPAQPKQVT